VRTRVGGNPDAGAARKDKRLRALYRRELQHNIRLSAAVLAVGGVLAVLSAFVTSPAEGSGYAAAVAPLIVVALVGYKLVTGVGRHYVIAVGMVLGLLPAVESAMTVGILTTAGPFALAGVALTPLAFAVFVPLERRLHVAWLAAVDAIYLLIALLVLVPTSVFHTGDATRAVAIIVAGVLGTLVSLLANEIEERRRDDMNGQLLDFRRLYGRMKEHEQDLRRQDEFLFMQQETLVVQQAELLRLNEELETIARIDALTGLGNRLRLNEDLAALAGRIERGGGTAGLLLMDLDRFKRLNDMTGHLAGDAALRGVADVLRKTTRVGDGLYRYGGEEFLIILHGCDESSLRAAAQRYVSAIEAAGMPHPDNPPYDVVTASAGAAELSQLNCTDIDAALHDADEALYGAKARGRNRLEVAPRPRPAYAISQERAAS